MMAECIAMQLSENVHSLHVHSILVDTIVPRSSRTTSYKPELLSCQKIENTYTTKKEIIKSIVHDVKEILDDKDKELRQR